MKVEKLAVSAEIDTRELRGLDDESAVKHVINIMRHKADEEAAKVRGARVLTDRLPTLEIKSGEHKLLGLTFLLVWSEWDVEMPEAARV